MRRTKNVSVFLSVLFKIVNLIYLNGFAHLYAFGSDTLCFCMRLSSIFLNPIINIWKKMALLLLMHLYRHERVQSSKALTITRILDVEKMHSA